LNFGKFAFAKFVIIEYIKGIFTKMKTRITNFSFFTFIYFTLFILESPTHHPFIVCLKSGYYFFVSHYNSPSSLIQWASSQCPARRWLDPSYNLTLLGHPLKTLACFT